MALPYAGRGASVGIGEEVTWGTPVAFTNWLRLTSATMTRDITREVDPTMGTDAAVAHVELGAVTFIASETAGLSIEFPFSYDDSTLMLLKHALGTVATTGAGPYVHTFTLATPLPTGLTAEIITGTSAKSEDFEGGKIASWEISGEAGKALMCSFDLICETSIARATKSSPTYSSAGLRAYHHQVGAISWNARTPKMVSFKISGDNGIDRRQLLGSSDTAEPSPENPIAISCEITIEYDSVTGDNIYADYIAQTAADLAFTVTGTTNNAVTFTIHNAIITSHSMPVSSRGKLTQTLTFTGYGDGTDHGVKIAITNDNASALTN